MYSKGERIIYGPSGICEIADIVSMKFNETEDERLYYMLHPYNQPTDSIYVPVEGNAVVMRQLSTKEEAENLMRQIPELDVLEVENSKLCDQKYRELVKTGELNQLITVLKTSYFHIKDRTLQNKKITAVDQRYFQTIKARLVAEFAIALEQTESDIEELFISTMDTAYEHERDITLLTQC